MKDLTYKQHKQISGKVYQWVFEDRGYDFLLLIFSMVLHLIAFRLFRPGWLNIKSRFICSELIATAFNKIAGITFGKYTASGYVTPADIGLACETNERMEIMISNA